MATYTHLPGLQEMMRLPAAYTTAIQMEDDPKHTKTIQLRDFFWDRVISTMLVLVFGVTSALAIVSYLTDEDLVCVITENHTASVQNYINQLCHKDVPNYGQFYNISLYAEIAILSGLQVFWSQILSGRIETFKSTVAGMSLRRNHTGQFETSDLDSVRYLERSLESTALTWTYMLKIGGQITVCILAFAFLTFYPNLEFSYSIEPRIVFECFNDSATVGQWPLMGEKVHCVLSELSNFQILRWFNFAALIVVVIANVVGMFLVAYSLYYYHLLDYKRVARFILYTGLRRDHYPEYHYKSGCNTEYEMCAGGCTHSCNFLIFSLFWWCKTSKCNPCLEQGCLCCYSRCKCCDEENFKRGLIPFDLTLLVVRLHGTHTQMGEALLNVLIDNHIDYLIKNECSKMESIVLSDQTESNECLGKYISG